LRVERILRVRLTLAIGSRICVFSHACPECMTEATPAKLLLDGNLEAWRLRKSPARPGYAGLLRGLLESLDVDIEKLPYLAENRAEV